MKEADLVAFFSRPYPGPGGAFKPPKYCTAAEKMPPKNCRKGAAVVSAVLDHSPSSVPAFNVADKIAENQRMFREAISFSLDSPVASAKAALPSSTPATQPKPPRPPVVRDAAESVPDFLKNRDLHGLEPALSVRTRILLACLAMSRMNMSLDIAKSFAVAGYFPRNRCDNKCCMCLFIHFIHRPAKLRAYQEELAAAKGELLPGERRVSGRRRDDQVRVASSYFFSPLMLLALSDLCALVL